jgi:hypothetical protein
MSQTEQSIIARCPSCAVKLKFRPSRPPRECPRCKKSIRIPPPGPVGADAELPQIDTSPPHPPHTPPKPHGFGSYLAGHWRASRWHWIAPFVLGLVAAAAASVAKPVLELSGLVGGAVAILGVSLISGITYLTGRVIDYAIRKRRDPKSSAPSWFGRLAHIGLVTLLPVSVVVTAEAFGPPEGWLAKVVPAVAVKVPSGSVKKPAADSPDPSMGGAGASRTPGGSQPAGDPPLNPANPFKVIEE